jgi:hypothetical protein
VAEVHVHQEEAGIIVAHSDRSIGDDAHTLSPLKSTRKCLEEEGAEASTAPPSA